MTLFPVNDGTVDELVAAADGSLRFKTSEGLEHKNAAIWRVAPGGAEIAKTSEDPAKSLGETASFPRKPVAPSAGIVAGSVIGADGNLWYGLQNGIQPAIGRLTPTGETTEFRQCLTYGQPYFGPETLVRGAEGNIWFTSLAQRSLPNISDPPSIGMITAAGAITQIYAGVRVEPKAIAADPEGGAWFAGGLEEIQRIKPPQGPVNTVHIGKLDAVRSNGSGLLTIKVPSAGRLKVQAVELVGGKALPPGDVGVVLHGPKVTKSVSVCGSPQVGVKLTGEALHVFHEEGDSAFVRFAVTFTPVGGTPYTSTKILHFRYSRPRR
jgi:hypothetical protein